MKSAVCGMGTKKICMYVRQVECLSTNDMSVSFYRLKFHSIHSALLSGTIHILFGTGVFYVFGFVEILYVPLETG